jgi:hypothetical protein
MDGDPESGASTSESGLLAPPLDAATGYGVGLTVVEAVLLALGYYGVLAINETGEFGQAVPEPFYRRSRPSASGLDPEGEGRKPR